MAVDIFDELVTVLRTFSAVTAVVGTGTAARIRPARFRRVETLPAIAIEILSNDPQNTLDGKGGLNFATVAITCRAVEPDDAMSLAQKIRTNSTNPGTGLAGYSGSPLDAVCTSDPVVGFTYADDSSDQGWWDAVSEYDLIFTETT